MGILRHVDNGGTFVTVLVRLPRLLNCSCHGMHNHSFPHNALSPIYFGR